MDNYAQDQSPGGWVPVTRAMDPGRAEMIAAELRAAGLPTRIGRESAGQAIGLSHGPLGGAQVLVPAWLESEARFVVDELESDLAAAQETESEAPDDLDLFSKISRGAMIVAGIAFSPIGVLLGVIAAYLSRRRD